MKITWYGTAGIMIESDGTQLLFDPFIPLNNKGYKPPLDELASAKSILVTHGHFDHIADIPAIWENGDGKACIYATKTPRETLISKGIARESIKKIAPDDTITIGPFEIRALKGRHVKFDKRLILKTLLRLRFFLYWRNLLYILNEIRVCAEAGEIVVYHIRSKGEQVLLLGSMNLDAETDYPKNVDLLVLPFQGRSDINSYAMSFIDRLRPKKVLLDHFDDAFPPISSAVETARFESQMREKYPDILVVCPQAGAGWVIE